MPKKLLWGIIVVLLITNVATLIFSGGDEAVLIEGTNPSTGSVHSTKDAVATVSEEEITHEEWTRVLQQNHGQATLKKLIDQKVVQRLADEKGIEIDEKVIERELSYLKTMNGPLTDEQYKRVEENFRDDVLFRFQLKFLLADGKSVPEEELEEYYEEYKEQYNFHEAMQLSHIVVSNRDEADKVYEELEAGASFSLLAKEYSLDEESRSDGGYLGFINTNSQFFPNGYKDIALETGEYTYSEPFVADNGFAIVYVHQILPTIEFSYEAIRDYMESELVLHEAGIDAKADELWNEFDIDWIYGE